MLIEGRFRDSYAGEQDATAFEHSFKLISAQPIAMQCCGSSLVQHHWLTRYPKYLLNNARNVCYLRPALSYALVFCLSAEAAKSPHTAGE